MKRTRDWALGAFSLAVFALGIFSVLSQAIAEGGYYKGKTLKVMTQGGAGGGKNK